MVSPFDKINFEPKIINLGSYNTLMLALKVAYFTILTWVILSRFAKFVKLAFVKVSQYTIFHAFNLHGKL